MADLAADPQRSWAEIADDPMEDNDQPTFADAVRRNRSHSVASSTVSSLPESSRVLRDNADRLGEAERDLHHPFNILPDRPCSAHFTCDKELPVSDIFMDFKNCGIRAAGVRCLQSSPNGFVSVTFSTADYQDIFLRKSSLITRYRTSSQRRRPSSSSSPFTFVACFDAPYELPDSALSHRLSLYSSVISVRRCGLQGYDGVLNGTRVVKMELEESIPSFLHFGRKLVRVKHLEQIPTCRKCHRPDHVAKSCPNTICFNCDQLGHTLRDCPAPVKCSVCKDEGHYAIDCHMSWWRRPTTATADDEDVNNADHQPSTLPPDDHPPPPPGVTSLPADPPSPSSRTVPPDATMPTMTPVDTPTASDLLLAVVADAAPDVPVSASSPTDTPYWF